ncbi:steroid 17-alpha-hydroxylase/17,20 lyase-like [Clytia hemisphaerica]|uniref:steroid 17-alpha-hydroxylase/17,20 lyase-like n=1 Tax=Clytia hemisphaerica TaxID=252671 RepID=UPI0034D5C1E7
MIATILLAIPGFVLLWVLITYVEHLISLRKYPKGPFPLPLIGNILLLSKKPHLSFIELGKKYGDVFSLSMGMKRVVVVNSYHGIKEALVTRSNDFAGRPISGNIHVQMITNNGKGLTSSDYSKKWSLLRKVTYKSLHLYGSGMKNIEEIVIDEVEKMCSLLSKEIGRPTIIDQYIGGSLISTIHYICFNKKYHTNDDEFLHILKYMKLISNGLAPG